MKTMQNSNGSAGATVVAPSDFQDTKSQIVYNEQVRRNFLRKRAQARARMNKNKSK